MKASRIVSSWRPMKRLAYGGAALVPMAVLTSWMKCLYMNERLLFLMIVSSCIPIVWGLGAPGSRVSSMQLHIVQYRIYALFMRYVGVK